jgi:hypothetical protein
MSVNPVFVALALTAVLITAVIVSGNTYAARCDKAYPGEPKKALECVLALSDGRPLP